MFPLTKPLQFVSATSLTSNVDTETVNSTSFVVQNPNSDHNLQFTVCRACLAMSGKMYHLSEYKLSVMYQEVTGVQINTEDKLPKMLCWECIARLSSANNFKNKALKSHWLLLKNINGGKFITMSDIESIDRAQYQLESTLGFKYNEVNNTDLHIQRENDITSEDHDASTVELVINKHEDSEFIEEVELFTIKCELLDTTEQQEEAELQVPKTIFIKENLSDEEATIDSVRNASETSEYENPVVHEERVFCEDIKQEQKYLSVTPLSNWSNGLPYNKELRVVLEDVMFSLRKQNTQDKEVTNNCVSYLKARSIENKKTHPTINKRTLTNSSIEAAKFIQSSPKNTSKTIYESTSKVNRNIDVTHYDVESSKNMFICDICNNSFKYKRSLKRHIQGHFNLYSCNYCGFKTSRKEYLTRHVNSKHTKKICFNCSYCSHTVYTKSDLNKHVNSRHTKNNVFTCSYCSYKAYDKSCLRKHVNNKHTKNVVLNCSYCDYKTYDKTHLNYHVNAKHTKNTAYHCSYCDYKAYRKSHLTYHVNAIHTKSTVFSCSHCEHKAYDRSALNRHVNVKHTKKVVFNCSYCSYKVNNKNDLNKHVNSKHTKNTVYNCSYCSYKSYNKSQVNRHVKRKH